MDRISLYRPPRERKIEPLLKLRLEETCTERQSDDNICELVSHNLDTSERKQSETLFRELMMTTRLLEFISQDWKGWEISTTTIYANYSLRLGRSPMLISTEIQRLRNQKALDSSIMLEEVRHVRQSKG